MARPAARLGDLHICPMTEHSSGVVAAPGEPSVLIGGRPSARYSDMAMAGGTAHAVAQGAPTVLIGRLPASRQLDTTEHAGCIIGGSDRVLIGETPDNITMKRRGKMLVVVDSNAHTIRILGVQEFSGNGASESYINYATNCINDAWSGPTTIDGEPYSVECMIIGRRAGIPANPLANAITVAQTTDPPSTTARTDPSNQSFWGDGPGYQHSTDTDDGILIPAHEFGHSMGLHDEHEEGPKDSDGNRTIIRTGPTGGLMGYIDRGSRPTPDNFNELVHGERTK